MQPTKADDLGSGDENDKYEGPPSQAGTGSGEGAASAYARMKSQHEHRARQKPADDPTHGGHLKKP